jgi:Tol biopolymer transport system component
VRSVTRITDNEELGTQIGPPVLSPKDDTLVYEEIFIEEGGGKFSNIWKKEVGSRAITRVTYGKWLDSFPVFTPDGENLVFSSNRTSENSTLCKIRVDGGGGITMLTNSLAQDYAPSVSSSGSCIAYTSNPSRADEPQIWTISMSGRLPTQLRVGESPQVSPDGTQILFIRKNNNNGRRQLWIMSIDGSSETQLTQNETYDVIHPNWSPVGNWIAYASNEGRDSKNNQNCDIWIMPRDGSGRIQLTTNGSRDDGPCWDCNGKRIYFRSNRGGAWNIWRFEPIL